ncbi:TadE family protein [Paenibacillus marinisediminis]
MNKKIKFFHKPRSCRQVLLAARKLMLQDRGSAAIEASLVFPLILLCTCVFMFFGMMIYMKVLTSHAAAFAAERSAVVWNNSSKDPGTGAFAPHQYDDLYWRALSDQMLDQLFGGFGNEQDYRLNVPANQSSSDSLPVRKLASGASFVLPPLSGELQYDNHWIERLITVSMSHSARSSMIANMTGVDVRAEGKAVSAIVEPAEFIRTVELVRYMTAKLQAIKPLGASPQAAGEVLKEKQQP